MTAEESQPSFVRNRGKISFTHEDQGPYGAFLNHSQVNSWKFALEKFKVDLDAPVVDLGCSYGSWASNWKALGLTNVTGVDVNPDVIEEAGKRLGRAVNGTSAAIPDLDPLPQLVCCNGMIVHVLDRDEELNIFKDVHAAVSQTNGLFMVAVLNSDFYISPDGFVPWTGPNSCTRPLEFHLEIAKEAGFDVVGQVGSFINPWFCEELVPTANAHRQKDLRYFEAMTLLADALRDAELVKPFCEILLVCRPRS